MNKQAVFFLMALGLFLASCVPKKDLVYLQDRDNLGNKVSSNQMMFEPYRLQTNDVINVTIKATDQKLVNIFNPAINDAASGKTEQSMYFDGFTVDDHGNIRVPVLGQVNVLGATLDEVRIKIETALLADYFTEEANVFVNVKLAGLRFTINGEIGSPGTKTLFQEKVTILEAIANSGDITLVGDRRNVTIIRKFATGTELHDIDLTDLKVMQSPYYYIQPNDYIYVKPLKQKTWGTGTTGIQSLGTIITILSLAATVFLLLSN